MVPAYTLLRQELSRLDINQTEAAKRLGCNRLSLVHVLSGRRPISAKFALKLEYLTGKDAIYWLNAQSLYELFCTRREKEG
jgi:addiction module HigA family antidote